MCDNICEWIRVCLCATCILQLSLDRGMQKHDSLGVETICLTCNQFVWCQGVYIKVACHKEEKKKKRARLHKSVFCSVPESLHGLRVVWRLSLMKWLTCNLETTKLLCLHANAAQFTSSPLLSKLEMLECLFNWASNLDWHGKRKKIVKNGCFSSFNAESDTIKTHSKNICFFLTPLGEM